MNLLADGERISVEKADTIMKSYDNIRNNSRNVIDQVLRGNGRQAEAQYYFSEVKAFVFELNLLKKYIEDIEKLGKPVTSLLIIKASDGNTPTAVVALSKKIPVSQSVNKYLIVPTLDQKLLEHPGKTGNIDFEKGTGNNDKDNFQEGDILIFTADDNIEELPIIEKKSEIIKDTTSNQE